VTTEAEEIQRKVSASVRDMLDTYRIQALAGPVADKALRKSSSGGARRRQQPGGLPWPATGRALAERGAHPADHLHRGDGGSDTERERVMGYLFQRGNVWWFQFYPGRPARAYDLRIE
jgi:hypothetical protein